MYSILHTKQSLCCNVWKEMCNKIIEEKTNAFLKGKRKLGWSGNHGTIDKKRSALSIVVIELWWKTVVFLLQQFSTKQSPRWVFGKLHFFMEISPVTRNVKGKGSFPVAAFRIYTHCVYNKSENAGKKLAILTNFILFSCFGQAFQIYPEHAHSWNLKQ